MIFGDRSLPAAGRASLYAIIIYAGITGLSGSPAFAQTTFPVASTGDIWFQCDHAGFKGEDAQVIEEYYFKIANNQLKFDPTDGEKLTGRVFITLKFKDADGDDLGKASHQFEFQVSDQKIAESPDDAQLLVLREPLDPRVHRLEIKLEDLNAQKRGLLYMLTGKRKYGSAEAVLVPPPFVGKEFSISDIQFAWEAGTIATGTEGPFEKSGLNVVPNPSRSYGLLQTRLTAYYEVYDLRPLPGPHTYFVGHELVDPRGKTVHTPPDTVEATSGEWVKVISFDLSRFATGEWLMRTVVQHAGTGVTATSERTFNVLWKGKYWDMSEQDVLDEARVLFREEEYERFRSMSAGDRAQYMEQFWMDADHSPNSGRNELREEFQRRVRYANRHYKSQRKGMLTDRGRLYIRFGEPDEVQREVMPTQNKQLDRQVEDLTDENISGSMLATHDEFDTRPYEIWIYTRQGSPLFPEREKTTSNTGLRFVFVDETGTGFFVLRYSSDFIGY